MNCFHLSKIMIASFLKTVLPESSKIGSEEMVKVFSGIKQN